MDVISLYVQPSLFDEKSIPACRLPSHLSAAARDGETIILWNRHYAVASFREDDDVSKRAAAVFLIQTKLGTYAEVASLMGWSESNLYVIMRQYRSKGLLSLFKQKKGPQKVTPEIQRYILQTKGRTYKEMVEHIRQDYGVSLTEPTIHYVKYGKVHQEQLNWFSDDLLQSLMKKESHNDSAAFQAEHLQKESKEERQTTEQCSVLEIDPVEDTPVSADLKCLEPEGIVPVSGLVSPESDQPGEERGQEQPVSSRYVGGFLLLPFLKQLDPVGLFQQVQQTCGKASEWPAHGYGLYRFMMTLLFLLWFRFSSLEDFKFVQPREFGVLLGTGRAPSVKTLRRYFPSVLDENVIDQWMLQLVRRYVQLDVIQLGTLYFDGHKIPYYGHTDLPKGYLSFRRFPAKLIEQVFANDRQGRPVFLRVHDTSISFKETVLGMIRDAQELWNERGIRSPLVVAFDRELYDTTFFAELDEMGVLYITWRKWDTAVPVERLAEEVRYPLSPEQEQAGEETAVQYRAWRRPITVQGYSVEAISFLDEEKRKKDPDRTPSTLVTNAAKFKKEDYPDFDPLSTGKIIDTLCGRWLQENYFRYSKHGQRLDYIPSYETKVRQEERMVSNPLKKELEKEIAGLRKEIDKINEKIMKKLVQIKKKNKPLEKVLQQKGMQTLAEQKEQAETRINAIKESISTLPHKVPAQPAEKPNLELVLEGKRFLDVLRIAMHNAEQMLLDVFKRCYSDPRDLHKVLRAIADEGGIVAESRRAITVRLKALYIPAYRRATEQLCRELNAMEPIMAENGKRIVYMLEE
jgi:transposase